MSHSFLTTIGGAGLVIGTIAGGNVAIGNGVDSGSVTGLALGFVPTSVVLTVVCPSTGFVLFAALVDGTITADGFDYILNGMTDSTSYSLNYILIP